jgi:thioredoxin reductase (NADPH)
MVEADERFPRFSDDQIERLRAFGVCGHAVAGDVIYDQGDEAHGVFVVISGSLEVLSVSDSGEAVLATLERGAFTGEVNQLSGRRSLVRCRAHEDSDLLEIGRSSLRHLMQTDAGLGEILLKAFVLRRVYLIES